MVISSERAKRLSVTWPAAAVVMTVLALGGISAGLGNPEKLVTSSFLSALKTHAVTADRGTGPAQGSGLVQLSGSEEFWLEARTGSAAVPVVLKDKLRLGDRVTFGTGADERRFEVVDISAVGELTAGSAANIAPLMLVTCRDTATPGGPSLRFVIERADLPTGTTRRTPHAL